MSLFGFLKKGKVEAGPATPAARLVWFELQVTPATFRFAFTPDQPVLISFLGENGQKAAPTLISPAQSTALYERIVGQVDALLQRNEIVYLRPSQMEQAFAADAVKVAGLHLRFAYSDDMSWASVYPPDRLPAEITKLLAEVSTLARQIQQQLAPLSGSAPATRVHTASETAKIKVTSSGAIFTNGQEMSPDELTTFLDGLKARGGEVAYSRESPETEPSEATSRSIQLLLDVVIERKVPIRLEVATDELLSDL